MVALLCIFLILSKAEHFSLSLLATFISFPAHVLFTLCTYFSLGCFSFPYY